VNKSKARVRSGKDQGGARLKRYIKSRGFSADFHRHKKNNKITLFCRG
jgi:hypothetical protein